MQPDVTLMLDMNDVVTDVTVSNTFAGEFVKTWLGRPWIETVAASGVEKARRSLDDARIGGLSAFRQILQRFPSGLELPIEYTTVRLGEGAALMVIGRNLQAYSELQARLSAAQEAMERDYWKLREVETRYRSLFDASNEAVLVLASDDMRVVEANPSAIRALGLARGWAFLNEVAPREREALRAMFARVRADGRAPGGVFHIGAQQSPWILRASLTSDDAAAAYMVQLTPTGSRVFGARHPVESQGAIRALPDAVVIIDHDGRVHSVNPAFLDLIQAKSEDAALGRDLTLWMGKGGADAAALLAGVKRQGQVRAFATVILGERGRRTPVSASAGADGDRGLIGVVMRPAASRGGSPKSLAVPPYLSLLETKANASLKEMVAAAVEAVERHHLESALRLTEGNRSAAAERLGLSRQSLYAKMNRYGLDGGFDVMSSSE